MLPDWEMALRLVIAAALGSLIGFERERLVWAAGLRTHMLVAVGACLTMIVSAYGFAGVLGPHVILDPSRIAAQVITGVGFLGAGSIILRNEVVKGLTTAASLWAVAAIGLAVGGGLYLAAAAATALILFILAGIKPLEERYRNRRATTHLRLQADQGVMSVGLLEQALGWRAAQVKQLVVRTSEEPGKEDITVTLGKLSPKDVGELIQILTKRPEFSNVSEMAG